MSERTEDKFVNNKLYREPWKAKPVTSPLSYAASSDLINSADSERDSVVTIKYEDEKLP